MFGSTIFFTPQKRLASRLQVRDGRRIDETLDSKKEPGSAILM